MNIDILTPVVDVLLVLPLIIIGMLDGPGLFCASACADSEAYLRVPLLVPAMISLAMLLGDGTLVDDSGIVVAAMDHPLPHPGPHPPGTPAVPANTGRHGAPWRTPVKSGRR